MTQSLVSGEKGSYLTLTLSKRVVGVLVEEALRMLVGGGVEDLFGARLEPNYFLF